MDNKQTNISDIISLIPKINADAEKVEVKEGQVINRNGDRITLNDKLE